MIRIALFILGFLFALYGAFIIQEGNQRGGLFMLIGGMLIGIMIGITLCVGPAVQEKTRKLKLI